MLGVALCGGGMKCAAHLGVLQALQEMGIRPALVAGSSMGAVMAAVYASGRDLHATAEEMYRIRMSDLFVGGLPLPGLNHARRLRGLLERTFGSRQIEELPVPLVVTACDLDSGTTCWFERGSLTDALYASCAMPGIFPPLETGGRLLADGCLSDPLPVGALRRRGARSVIGVNFGLPQDRRSPRRMLPLARRSLSIMMDTLAQTAASGLDLLLRPPVAHMPTLIWSERNLRFCLEAGRQTALELSAELMRFREGEVRA